MHKFQLLLKLFFFFNLGLKKNYNNNSSKINNLFALPSHFQSPPPPLPLVNIFNTTRHRSPYLFQFLTFFFDDLCPRNHFSAIQEKKVYRYLFSSDTVDKLLLDISLANELFTHWWSFFRKTATLWLHVRSGFSLMHNERMNRVQAFPLQYLILCIIDPSNLVFTVRELVTTWKSDYGVTADA